MTEMSGQPLESTGQPDGMQPPGDGNWQDLANCMGVDPELFFPGKGVSQREAKAICWGCVVREACLEYALDHREGFGIWGGMSERERRMIRRRASLGDASTE